MTLTDPSTRASNPAIHGMHAATPLAYTLQPGQQPEYQPRHSPIDTRAVSPVLDVTLPVFNEADHLEDSLRTLHGYLTEILPYTFRITVADNASTDGTLRIAERLAREFPEVKVASFQQKARGNALRQVWLSSQSPVLAYMEPAFITTNLQALAPLLASLVSGHSDLAIGTRPDRTHYSSHAVRRGPIPGSYDAILRTVLGPGFSDARSGFKAIRSDVAHRILPYTEDDGWFFDTELLVIAQRCGLRIHEVPVDWTQETNPSVDVVRTALKDLRAMVRLTRRLGRVPFAELRAGFAVPPPGPGPHWFRAVVWAVACAGVFLMAASVAPPVTAGIISLVLGTTAVRLPYPALPTFLLALALSSGALLLLPVITRPDRWLEGAMVAGAVLAAHLAGRARRRKTLAA